MTLGLRNSSSRQAADFKWPGLLSPNGDRLRLNRRDFVAIDRDRDAKYEAIFRPQALYNVATEGLRANNGAFLLQEVATNLAIYRPDTGPTDFHLHLPPGGFQLVLVTSGVFTFDYDGRVYYVGPGTVMLQSAIVHRQLFYTWSGLPTDESLKTPQTAVPDPISMGYSGKFLEAFITEPAAFPNPTIVASDSIVESETPKFAWSHPLHNRPPDAGFWCQDPLALEALYLPLVATFKSAMPVYVRDIGIEVPSGHLVTGHIIATDPRGQSLLPKSAVAPVKESTFAKGESGVYRVIRGTAEFRERPPEARARSPWSGWPRTRRSCGSASWRESKISANGRRPSVPKSTVSPDRSSRAGIFGLSAPKACRSGICTSSYFRFARRNATVRGQASAVAAGLPDRVALRSKPCSASG